MLIKAFSVAPAALFIYLVVTLSSLPNGTICEVIDKEPNMIKT